MPYARQTLTLHSTAPDLIPQDAPEDTWNSCSNVVFRDNASIRVSGDAPTLVGATTPALAMVYCEPFDTPFWVYCTSGGIYAHDGAIEYDITPAWWSETDPDATYTATILNGLPFFNASDRDPAFWAGETSTGCEALPDWPTNGRCYALRAHKSFLLALGFVSEGEQRVRWSDAAEAGTVPQHWTPAADNLAGFVDLAPMRSPVLEGKSMRDDFMVYKQDSVWAFTFVGGNDVFRVAKRFSRQGIRATNALCAGADDTHLFVGSDGDAYLTDGVHLKSILDGRATRTFSETMTTAPSKFSAATFMRQKIGVLIVPQGGDTVGTMALLYDFTSSDIGFREVPDVTCAGDGPQITPVADLTTDWDSDDQKWKRDASTWSNVPSSVTFNDVLVGAASGFFNITSGEAEDFSSGPVMARLEKHGLALGDASTRKMIGRVWPRIRGETGDVVQVRVGGQEITEGAISWADPVDFVVGSDTPVNVFRQGRFLSLQITSSGGASWRLGSIDIEVKGTGGW